MSSYPLSATFQYQERNKRWVLRVRGEVEGEKVDYLHPLPREQDLPQALSTLQAHHCWQVEAPVVQVERQRVFDPTWLRSAQAAALLGVQVSDLERERLQGKWLGMWVEEAFDFMYPPFQFSPRLDREVFEKLMGIVTPLKNTTGWNRLTWFIGGHTMLDGKCPLDMILIDPVRVLEAAESSFDPKGNW